jgi:hypothetical protein
MTRKRKPRRGRPPKRESERKNRYVTLPLEASRLKAYKEAAAKGFKGNLADFLRAAADDLAARLDGEAREREQERAAFWREIAALLRDKLGQPPEA